MRPPARLSAQVPSVPDLLSRIGVAGTNSRRGEIELVEALPFRLPTLITDSIGNWQLEIESGVKE